MAHDDATDLDQKACERRQQFSGAKEASDSGCTDPVGLLNEVRNFLGKFCAFPDEHCLNAVTLWAAHAHMVEHIHVTPRLALLSPEAASGKTRVLDVLELLVPEPEYSLSASPASIFRLLSENRITLLFDEVDAIWNKKGQDNHHEDLRALLNAGYKRGATIPRCVGNQHEVQRFPVFCAVALAGLGSLPETIMSRSIIIRMRRRAPDERVSEFRSRRHAPAGRSLRDRLANWAEQVGAWCGDAWPEMPKGIVDRPAEVWEPLIAIADAAGGHWPQASRDACVALCRSAEDRHQSLGVRLLADLRTIFGDANVLSTATILERLTEGDSLEPDAPWSNFHGKPIGDRGLASILKKYGIRSVKVKVGGRALKGYRREHLWDAWQRYLPPLPAKGEPEEPAEPTAPKCGVEEGARGSPTDLPKEPTDPPADTITPRSGAKVPQVPHSRKGGAHPAPSQNGGCPACAGEGCRWCASGDGRPIPRPDERAEQAEETPPYTGHILHLGER